MITKYLYLKTVDSEKYILTEEDKANMQNIIKDMNPQLVNIFIDSLIHDTIEKLVSNKEHMNLNMVQGRNPMISAQEATALDEEFSSLYLTDKELKKKYHCLRWLQDYIKENN